MSDDICFLILSQVEEMKKEIILTLFTIPLLSSCDFVDHIEEKSARVNRYEKVALQLAKKNREQELIIGKLRYDLQKLKSEKNYLTIKLEEAEGKTSESKREVASIKNMVDTDLVNDDVYHWQPSQILAVARSEFEKKNFEKSAQYFQTFIKKYPNNEAINDELLFQAGVAAYESGKHYDWTIENLGKLVKNYPTSPYYRGGRLWLALTQLNMGDHQAFFGTVEEFRKKYRNTNEWKVLSQHYERIVQKYKRGQH